MYFDQLENRVLFAGVTILAHGLDGDINGWISSAANAIQAKVGGTSAASQYVMKLDKSGGNIVVTSLALEKGNIPLDQTTAGEAIIKLDWSNISGADQNTGPVAQAVVDYLTAHHKDLPDFVDLPIQLIGHSKGGSLVSEISKDFGKQGIWVDQMTALDPVGGTAVNIPFVGTQVFGDPVMASYDNVIFVDDYYRNGMQPSGQSFDGAHVVNLSDIVTDDYLFGAHNGVTVYYDATIDPNMTSAGGMPVLDSWFGNSADKPARTQTGYDFTRLGGGLRPADGVSSAFGGSASRVAAGQTGLQYANAYGPAIAGGNSLNPGQSLTLSAMYEDRDSGSTITFFLDNDNNPLNGTGTELGSKKLNSVSADQHERRRQHGGRGGRNVLPGAAITDADGHVRYVYNTSAVNVAVADFASVDNQGVVTVSGTPKNDLFTMTEISANGSDVLQIVRNGVTQNIPTAGITRINLATGDGDDTLLADASVPAIYAFGGNGNDSLSGGSGNDTLTGGAGENTLMGNDGDDRLTGSGGHDVLYGGNGSDRLYGMGGDDTLDGGGGVDRLWGGDGNDLMLGGGSNDKMYGEAGADTFNGQAGNDLFGDVDGQDSIISAVGDSIVQAPPV